MKFTLSPEKWVENYANIMYNSALWQLKDEAQAKDALQETFLSALKAKENFKGESSEKTWLFSILNNKIKDVFRKKNTQKAQNTGHLDWGNDVYSHFFDETEHWTKDTVPKYWEKNPQEDLEKKEVVQTLYDCIAKLPSQQSSVLTQSFFDEQNTDQVCKDNNITASNFWVIIHRAKLFLRKCLEKNAFDNPQIT